MSASFVGTLLLNKYLEYFYKSRKIVLENKIEKFLNKDIDLGDYSGMRLLGISLNNFKIIDDENLNSQIIAKNIYIGIMPIRSFLNQRWIFNVTPTKTKIEITKDFFKRGELDNNEKIFIKNKIKTPKFFSIQKENFNNKKLKKNIIKAKINFNNSKNTFYNTKQ